jgi:apolipoprotein N-acyltransferase
VRAGHVAWLRAGAPQMRVGLVQPDFGIVSAEDRKRHGQDYVDLLRAQTDELGRRGAELVVWPESAFPYLFDRQLQREFAGSNPWALRGSFQGTLLVGALTHTFGGSNIYNSAVLVAPDGRVAGRYDKVSLMPFGEYIPLAERFPEWAERTRERMPDASNIAPGAGVAILESGPLRVGPMICYEDILPETGEAIGLARPAANLLVTLANHSWFGDSLVPREALALATLRSVELRRDLVRATSTGVSSIGDALGRVTAEGPLVDPIGNKHLKPELLEGQVALVGAFALGPYSAPLFPYACGVVLAACAWGRRKRRE